MTERPRVVTSPPARASRGTRRGPGGGQGSAAELLEHPLFKGVAASLLEELREKIAVTEVARGTLLNTPGVSPARLHLVIRGRLRAYQVTSDGRELLLELIPAGRFDGLLSMAGRRGHFTEAQSDSLVVSIDLSTLERLIAGEPRVAANLLEMILDRLEGRERQLEAVVLRDPDQQLARQLLALAETLGRDNAGMVVLDPRITHQMLADMLGVRRETVTVHLSRLASLGALAVDRGRFTLDVVALRRIADGAPRSRRRGRRRLD